LNLASKFKTTPKKILELNRVRTLSRGQVINLPGTGITPPTGQVYGMPRVNYDPLRTFAANQAYKYPAEYARLNPSPGTSIVPIGQTYGMPVSQAKPTGQVFSPTASIQPQVSRGRYTDLSAYRASETGSVPPKTGGVGEGPSTAGSELRLPAQELISGMEKTGSLMGAMSFTQAADLLSKSPEFSNILSQYYVRDTYSGQFRLNAMGLSYNQQYGGMASATSSGKYWEGTLSTQYSSGGSYSPWSQDIDRRFAAAAAQGVNLGEQNAQQLATLGGYTTGKSSTTGKDRDLRWWLKGK
jgi:hypothetical protein